MEKITKENGTQAQGAGVPPINVETVKGYLNKDLSIAISCLQAIQSDPDLLQTMAVFMHGRMINFENAKLQAKLEKPEQN